MEGINPKNRNPYTGMEMAKENTGNGEVIKVDDLVNKEQPEWEYKEPIDTLTNADSELTELYDSLSKEPTENSKSPDTISVEDLMNSDKKDWQVKDKFDSVLDGNIKAQIGNRTQLWELDNKSSNGIKKDDLSLKDDELINNLTNILN